MTVLWSPELPEGFKEFCAKVSIDTSSIQYENDDLMREVRQSDDYGIACCVSYQEIGKQIQFFGARCNLAKALLLAINGGRCENTGTVMVKNIPVLTSDTLKFEEVMDNYKKVLIEIARVYNEAMNIIHYMHDKYYYEKAQMALVDTNPRINLAYGVAGLSIALDSLSAIKYAKVTARRNDIFLQRRIEETPGLQECPSYPLPADHHFQRDVRKEDRCYSGRTCQRRCLRSGC